MQDCRVRRVVWVVDFPDVPWLLARLPSLQRVEQHPTLQCWLMGRAEAITEREADRSDGARRPHLARCFRHERNQDSGQTKHLDLALNSNHRPVAERAASR